MVIEFGRGELPEQLTEPAPLRPRRSGRSERLQRVDAESGHRQVPEASMSVARAHAREKLQYPECGNLVLRVLRPFQYRQHILHMCSLEELKPAILDVGNVAADQLDFQPVAVM